MDKPYLDFPFSIDGSGRTATTDDDNHIRDMIELVLFTNPGERVNLPQFGAGIQRLLFSPSSDTLRTSTQFLISTSLSQWLGDRIDVQQVNVASEPGFEEQVTIEVVYTVKATQQQQTMQVKL